MATPRTQGVRRMETHALLQWEARSLPLDCQEVLVRYLFPAYLKSLLSHLLAGILPVPCIYSSLGCLGSSSNVGLPGGKKLSCEVIFLIKTVYFLSIHCSRRQSRNQTSVISKRGWFASPPLRAYKCQKFRRMLARSCQKIWHQIGLGEITLGSGSLIFSGGHWGLEGLKPYRHRDRKWSWKPLDSALTLTGMLLPMAPATMSCCS